MHLTGFPSKIDVCADDRWAKVMEVLESTQKTLELSRNEQEIDNPLDTGISISDPDGILKDFNTDDLADFCGVSRVELSNEDTTKIVDLRDEPRCDRSWKRDGSVKLRSDGGMLSDRDASAVGVE